MAQLTDFEKNVLGATGYQDDTGEIVPIAPAQDTTMDIPEDIAPTEAPKKSLFGRIAKGAGNFLLGAAKGAGDTLLSVPRNVSKVVESASQISQQSKMNKLRDQITQQNNTLLETMKSFPVGDPRREKYKGLIQQNLDQLNQINADEQDVMDTISKEATYIPGDKTGSVRATVDDAMSAKNKAQQLGFRGEKIAELLVPAGATAKADKALSGMKIVSDTAKGGKFINAASRILAKSGLEAGAAGASTLGQAGYQGRFDTKEGAQGAFKEAKQNALFAGGAKMLMATGGEILNAAKVPQKLAAKTYKANERDVVNILHTYGDEGSNIPTYYHGTTPENKASILKNGIDTAKNSKGFAEQPEAFYAGTIDEAGMYGKDFVALQPKSGVKINTLNVSSKEWADTVGQSKNAKETAAWLKVLKGRGYDAVNYGDEFEILNPSKFDVFDTDSAGKILGKKADVGETLADWAVKKNLRGNVKSQARQVMKLLDDSEKAVMDAADSANVKIPVDKGLRNFADDLAEEYAGYGRGEVGAKVQNFLDSIDENGTTSVRDAIKFRRLIDSLRSKASFRNAKVGDNIAYWADDMRNAINSIDNIDALNKDYAMAMRARDALIRKAISEENKQLVGALEMYTAAMPMTSGAPNMAGVGAVAGKRMLNSPKGQMFLARTAKNLGNSTKAGIGFRRILPEVVRDTVQPSEDTLY